MYSVLSDGRDPDNLLAIREICQEMGRDDLAEEDFGDLESARAASLVEAHSRRGLVLVSRGQLAEAEAEYLQGLAIDQDSARLRYNLGKLRYRLKRYEEGSADILQAARSGISIRRLGAGGGGGQVFRRQRTAGKGPHHSAPDFGQVARPAHLAKGLDRAGAGLTAWFGRRC